MIWLIFILIATLIVMLAIAAWAYVTYSRYQEAARQAAMTASDRVVKEVQDHAEAFLKSVIEGADAEHEAETLRKATSGLIPGYQGTLPAQNQVDEYSRREYQDHLSKGRRRVLAITAVCGGIVLLTASLVWTAVYETTSRAPAAAPVSPAPSAGGTQFVKPVFN